MPHVYNYKQQNTRIMTVTAQKGGEGISFPVYLVLGRN